MVDLKFTLLAREDEGQQAANASFRSCDPKLVAYDQQLNGFGDVAEVGTGEELSQHLKGPHYGTNEPGQQCCMLTAQMLQAVM